MTSNPDTLEDRTAAILGQIQASVAEYVRTMNEAGALRRREADEAHRQQDDAIKALRAIQVQVTAHVEAHAKLAARLGSDWLALVERGLRETAMAQAETAARASVTQLDARLSELNATVHEAVTKVRRIADRNEQIAGALAWKTVGITAIWLVVSALIFRIVVF